MTPEMIGQIVCVTVCVAVLLVRRAHVLLEFEIGPSLPKGKDNSRVEVGT